MLTTLALVSVKRRNVIWLSLRWEVCFSTLPCGRKINVAADRAGVKGADGVMEGLSSRAVPRGQRC